MGLESMSEPDDLDLDDEEGEVRSDEVEVDAVEPEANENENDDEPFLILNLLHSSQGRAVEAEGAPVIRGTKARMSIRRMIPLDRSRLDLGQSLSLWIGLSLGLPSRG
jgi:hypothetical protein